MKPGRTEHGKAWQCVAPVIRPEATLEAAREIAGFDWRPHQRQRFSSYSLEDSIGPKIAEQLTCTRSITRATRAGPTLTTEISSRGGAGCFSPSRRRGTVGYALDGFNEPDLQTTMELLALPFRDAWPSSAMDAARERS